MKELLTLVRENSSSLIGSSDKRCLGAKLFLCHISIPGKLAVVLAVILMVSLQCGPIETALTEFMADLSWEWCGGPS